MSSRHWAVTMGILCSAIGLASPPVRLVELGGVRLGSLRYAQSEGKRDRKIEAALAETYRIPNGHEVRYLYNHVALTAKGKHVFVLLVSSDFESTQGHHGVLLERVKETYRPVTHFVALNHPVLISSTGSNGWKDVIVVSGTHYARLPLRLVTNPSQSPALKAGTTISGTALFAEQINDKTGIRFVVGNR